MSLDFNDDMQYNDYIERDTRLDIVIGLPSTGKSSVIVDSLSQEFRFKLIDNDMVKAGFMEEFRDGLVCDVDSGRYVKPRLIDIYNYGNRGNLSFMTVSMIMESVLRKERGIMKEDKLKELGAIATYDLSDMEDIMEHLLTQEEQAKMSLEERMNFSKLLRPSEVEKYLMIIEESEKMTKSWEEEVLNEKEKTILKTEVKNSIRRELLQEAMKVDEIVIQKVLKKLETKALSFEERITMAAKMYPEILLEYRKENNIQKQVTETVNHLVDYLMGSILSNELVG